MFSIDTRQNNILFRFWLSFTRDSFMATYSTTSITFGKDKAESYFSVMITTDKEERTKDL